MLTRVITALILAPVFIFLTLALPTTWYSAVLLAVMLLALYEWNQLTVNSQILFPTCAIALAVATWWMIFQVEILIIVCVLNTLYWIYQIFDLKQFGLNKVYKKNRGFFEGVFCLFGIWAALVLLHQQENHGPGMTIAILVIVWATDSFAYFVGKAIGKHKLTEISPKKTIEGVVGGLVGAGIVASFFGVFLLNLDMTMLFIWTGAGFLAAICSVAGDLYESRLKRLADVKDSGALLPGHGGVLDRIDGLIAAAPVFTTIWYYAK